MRINLTTLKSMGFRVEIDVSMGYIECMPTGNELSLQGLETDLARSGLSMASRDAVYASATLEYMRQQMLLAITD